MTAKAKRLIYNVKTGKLKEEEFEFTPYPPLPKQYLIFKLKRLKTGKEIRLHERFVGELTNEEIDELKADGWKVEEAPV